MEIIIVKDKISLEEVDKIAKNWYGEMVKVVADVEGGIMAVGGEFHSEGAEMLFNQGSKNENLWGFNIYTGKNKDEWLEFNSLVNIKPLAGNRSMEIESEEIKNKIRGIVNTLIK
jgi:hypothetical protein